MKMNDIEEEQHVLCGASSFKHSTIYNYIVKIKFSQEALEEHGKRGRKIDSQLLNRIHDVLKKILFSSSYVIVHIINETQTIVYKYLTNYFGLF
jgi:hypothetical protein